MLEIENVPFDFNINISQLNLFFETVFILIKFFVFLVFLSIGILTVLKWRGKYLISGTQIANVENKEGEAEDQVKRVGLFVGISYIILAFGFISNFILVTYYIILNPLPDGFFFTLIQSSNSSYSESLPMIELLYPIIGLFSFFAVISIIVSFLYIVSNTNKDLVKPLGILFAGIIAGVFMGFTTWIPYFL